MHNIRIGTSGYSYKDWVGPVYPPGTPSKDFLDLYEQEFNFTELNFSYYCQPNPRTLERMVHVTGDEFLFSIKAHKSITHEITNNCNKDIQQFIQGISPLIRASKLAVVLIQFPFSFHYTAAARRHLALVCNEFRGIPVAVEFRNNEWQKESVYRGLENFDVAFVNVDVPALQGLPKIESVVTSSISYIRFHGRNKEQWWKGTNASRYDYLYNDEELAEWVPRIKTVRESRHRVIVAFNNHWKGQAVTNARRMKELIFDL